MSAPPGQPARTATGAVAWTAVTVVPPRQPRGRERSVPLPVGVIRVGEPDPPTGVEPFAWILLTNVATSTWEEVGTRIDWYAGRAVGAEYHKAPQTGGAIEPMPFGSVDRLQPAIGLVSVVAVALLPWRARARRAEAAQRPATNGVPVLGVEALAVGRYGERRPELTLAEFLWALARLGGHPNRPSDGAPGWQTLWRGWTQLQAMVRGVQLLDSPKWGGT